MNTTITPGTAPVSTRSFHPISTTLLPAILGTLLVPLVASTESPATPPPDPRFTALHNLIKPAPGESRWMEITWFPSIWEARQHAATQGKPLFLLAGSGGAPVAGC